MVSLQYEVFRIPKLYTSIKLQNGNLPKVIFETCLNSSDLLDLKLYYTQRTLNSYISISMKQYFEQLK